MKTIKEEVLNKTVNGWSSEEEYPGIVCWYHPQFKGITIIATPNYDGDNRTPFQLDFGDGTSIGLWTTSDDIKDYFDTLKEAIKLVEKIIEFS